MESKSNETKKKEQSAINLPEVEEMLKAGVHFGHSRTKLNPKMKDFVLGYQQGICILDLTKTRNCLARSLAAIEEAVKKEEKILFIGTRPVVRDLIKELAEEVNMPYVNNRWVGGTLTNFKIISKRIKHLLDLEEQAKKGELDKYTKKERLMIKRQIEKMEQKFGGIKKMQNLPGIVVIADPKENNLAVWESKKVGIPIVAICDADVDPTLIDYPIPANDEAISSVKMILNLIKSVFEDLKK